MTDFRKLCAELVDNIHRGSSGMLGWTSEQEDELLARARAALAEPEPEEPTDEELLELTDDWPATTDPRHDLSGCPEVPLYSVFADEVIEFARAVLARWGNHPGSPDSSPQPVPVSERLPGPGDCDAEGRCWIGRPEYTFPMGDTGKWCHADSEWCLEKPCEAANSTAVWLPAHALPVPTND